MFSGRKRYWLFQFVGWGAFFAMHLFFAWFYGKFENSDERQLFVSRAFAFVVMGFIITHFMRLAIIKMGLLNKKNQQQIPSFLFLSIVVALLCGVIELQFFTMLRITNPREVETIAKRGFGLVALSNALSWFIYIFIWNAIYLMYHYIMDYQKQQIDTLQLKSLVKELELKTIKSHINPHFIFN